jgi:hypothetical protein
MTVDEHLSFVLAVVNGRMHEGTCPGAGALGECAAISPITGYSGHTFYVASLYLWDAAMHLQPATVAAWFTAAFCTNVVVSAIRGYVEKGQDAAGEFFRVLREPAEGSSAPEDSNACAQSQPTLVGIEAVEEADNRWFGDMMILQVLVDSEHVNDQEREVLTRWMANSAVSSGAPPSASLKEKDHG